MIDTGLLLLRAAGLLLALSFILALWITLNESIGAFFVGVGFLTLVSSGESRR